MPSLQHGSSQQGRPHLGANLVGPSPTPQSGNASRTSWSNMDRPGPQYPRETRESVNQGESPSFLRQGQAARIQQSVDLSSYGFGSANRHTSQNSQQANSQQQFERHVTPVPQAVLRGRPTIVFSQQSGYRLGHQIYQGVRPPCRPQGVSRTPNGVHLQTQIPQHEVINNESQSHNDLHPQFSSSVPPQLADPVVESSISRPTLVSVFAPASPSQIPRRILPFPISKVKGSKAALESDVRSERSQTLQTSEVTRHPAPRAANRPGTNTHPKRCNIDDAPWDNPEPGPPSKRTKGKCKQTLAIAPSSKPNDDAVQQAQSSLPQSRSTLREQNTRTVPSCSAERFAEELEKTKKILDRNIQTGSPLDVSISHVQQTAVSFQEAISGGGTLLGKVMLQQFIECFSGERYEEMIRYLENN